MDFNFRTTIQLIGKELNIRYFYIIFFTIYKNTKKFSLWTLTCNRKLKILLVFIKLI
ncbi:hypothetical protein [Paenibacillus larvae]|uniref:hypothetical protein n=1 Tax=Paenibacillus larvae TaxID=1464 RepID=UPI002853A96E|nr:hypothetical protein [Paenibacillus larvae]MDR5583438.1 hypothetical protein [Paenibacillus larvae]MDT2240073.1 hypothetical protein [Paenibacillus larvae]MDT2256541.1 hypothetical protein [Paenibacillus larvae]MDT2274410.1 hypothetical protein [Paenibacillus larvae]MDT2303485.1 hypothetical protein [Paenibacillus larvae]